jgi:hypothetical protein
MDCNRSPPVQSFYVAFELAGGRLMVAFLPPIIPFKIVTSVSGLSFSGLGYYFPAFYYCCSCPVEIILQRANETGTLITDMRKRQSNLWGHI